MNTGAACGPSDASLELIAANGKVRVKPIVELCQRILDGFGITGE